jgi:FAD/FMN-containing dehydrogenase
VHGLQRYWRSAFTEELSDALIDEFVAAAGSFSSPMNALLMFYIHGAICRVPASATAFSARRPQWDIDAIACWIDPAESATHIDWVRALWSRLEPHLLGSVYVNHITADDRPEKVRASFGENHARLRRIKAAYDPGNLFRVNSNISPDA